MRWRRGVGVGVVVMLSTVGLTACKSNGDQIKTQVDNMLLQAEQVPGRFLYEDKTATTDTVVKGVVADDDKYESELAVNGTPVVDEVDVDDAVADLFLVPNAVPLLARRSAGGQLLPPPPDATAPTADGLSVLQALSSQRWVVDPTGAADVYSGVGTHPIGQDPIFDARDVFSYVLTAISQGVTMVKYDSESISPAYKPQDDPFPKPAFGSAITRYDLVAPSVPTKTQQSGGNEAVPSTADFRKLVVYVEHGRVIRIMEQIDLTWRLQNIKSNYSLSLSGTTQQQDAAALAAINAVTVGQGNTPIRPRLMDYQIIDPGVVADDITLPANAVVGPLDVLVNRGAASAGTTTSTTEPPEGATPSEGSEESTAETTPTPATTAPASGGPPSTEG